MVADALAHYETLATPSANSYSGGTEMMNPFNWHMGPQMMGFWSNQGMMGGWQVAFWLWSILAWVTWILVIVALIALIRWLWKKGDK